MNQKQFQKFLAENPGARRPALFRRPDWTRRNFFQVMGAGVAGSCFVKEATAQTFTGCTSQQVTTKNTAKNVIFILMAGAPSHMGYIRFQNDIGRHAYRLRTGDRQRDCCGPRAFFRIWAAHVGDFAIVRSLQAHALVHSLGQTWVQIGRNPAAALGNIAPNIGSIVALEMAGQRKPSDVLPTFLALNSDGGGGLGIPGRELCAVQIRSDDGGTCRIPPIRTGRRAGRKC